MWQKGIKLFVGLMCASLSLHAQENNKKVNKKEVGLRVAYGIINEELPEGSVYKPILVLPYYNHYFTKAESRARFSAILEQQVGLIRLKHIESNREDQEWEFGLNAGPEVSYRLGPFRPYLGAMYGVDFITVKTEKQENGWILAATGYSGIKIDLHNNLFADFHARVRHISNGGIKEPNYGIDNFLLGVGVSKMY